MEIVFGKKERSRLDVATKLTASLQKRDSIQLVLEGNLIEVFYEQGTGWVVHHSKEVVSRCVGNEATAPNETSLETVHDAYVWRAERPAATGG